MNHIEGDRALEASGVDRLGFQSVARRVAAALSSHASDGGLVVGIEGKWGSGKSSLLNLIEKELREISEKDRPTIINFRPWLVGSRDSLLLRLFDEFSTGIDRFQAEQGDTSGMDKKRVKQVAEDMRAFAFAVSKFGAFIEVAGEYSANPAVKWGGKAIKSFSEMFKKEGGEPSLVQMKDRLWSDLDVLKHRFVVTIDDVDRLEPVDLIEVMRLVRSVADFPNVIYLLCYDSEILKGSVEQITKVNDGLAFLEKIVQLTVAVPKPEPFQLRSWFAEELSKLAVPEDEGHAERLRSVIDVEGGRQLLTPRSVVKTLDAVRFFWPPLQQEGADLSDLVWLLLIKGGNPDLYRWIEGYCGVAALLSLGMAQVGNVEASEELENFLATVNDERFSDHNYRYEFAEKLPGMKAGYTKNAPLFELYRGMKQEERDAAISDKRLKSPDHYRLYFAFSQPSHALLQADFDAFWDAVDAGPLETGALLLEWNGLNAAASRSKAEMLLERVSTLSPQVLSAGRAKTLLFALGDSLDDFYRQRRFDSFSFSSPWILSERLAPTLLSSVGDERRAAARDLFVNGKAIGWITSILRHEIFAHGKYGKQAQPEEKWTLTSSEFDEVLDLMIERYRTMQLAEVLEAPVPLNILYAWLQGGDEEGPRKMLKAGIEEPTMLVSVLEALKQEVNSSDRGRYYRINRNDLAPFLDVDDARARVEVLASAPQPSPLRERARSLVQLFEAGE